MTEITQAEAPNLADLYPQAFPDEDLLPLVRQMVGSPRWSVWLPGLPRPRLAIFA